MENRFRFRAWNKIEQIYDYDIQECQKIPLHNSNKEKCFACFQSYLKNQDVLEIEQFTGLKDKNGKLIYEGDILAKSPTYSPSYGCYKVFFQKDECSFKVIPCDGSHDYAIPLNVLTKKKDFQIIGNIHENPELLEATND